MSRPRPQRRLHLATARISASAAHTQPSAGAGPHLVPGKGSAGNVQKAALVRPFLRWAGGKRQIVDTLARFVPPDFPTRHYHEPFVGAGSLFFWLGPENATLSDANQHLIETYKAVRDDWPLVARHLSEHAKQTSQEHYYRVRHLYNCSKFSAAQAARFIYLNKTCFNGIFRVNLRGQFNVPYGQKEPPAIPTRAELKTAAGLLSHAALESRPFEEAFSMVSAGDFVYLDPPYPPLNGTAYFTHYTKDRFTGADQARLASAVRQLSDLGCQILMSSADVPLIRRLYKGFRTTSLQVTRFITCKAVRHTVRELVITNY